MSSPFISIENFKHPGLQIDTFVTGEQTWCFYGGNDSGIDLLVDLFSGRLEKYQVDTINLPQKPAVVSFKAQQEFFEEELRNDDSDFLDRFDPGTLVREIIGDTDNLNDLIKLLDLHPCLDLGYRQLSSGQARKVLLLQALAEKPSCLILENPLDGLDERSCRELMDTLSHVQGHGIGLCLFVNNIGDIPSWCDNIAIVEDGRLAQSGEKKEMITCFTDRSQTCAQTAQLPAQATRSGSPGHGKKELVLLRQGFGSYGEKKIFSGLDLCITTGDHTLICGPNGCGKSTLLDIITGDNPKCYANELYLFGRRRGSGESIWDLKKRMGIISPSLHRDHRVAGTALHIVLSGLYDSIGLYRHPHNSEVRIAARWLDWLGLAECTETPFRKLSFARQRLILIGRALIKGPELLVLDEPTQGLDQQNREKLLDILERIAQDRLSTILYVSHRKDEYRSFFTSLIELNDYHC